MRRLSGTWLASVLAYSLGTHAAEGARAQVDPLILHSAIECWPQTEFVILRAVFQPGVEIATAKAYFRSNMYPDFYYVGLAVQPNGQGEAILPKPGPETTSVIYYLEAVTRTYTSARSAEWSATVADPDTCKRRYPGVAWFQGDSPNIVVGATRMGAGAIPPGFQAQGITGFVNASGVASGAGGGFGTGATIAAIGGAAAGLGVLGVAAGGDDSTTTTVAAAQSSSSTTTTAATTTVSGSAPLACFTTQPSPPTIFENESIRFDASCSRADALTLDTIVNYYWDFGNGKIVEGPDRRVVNTLFTTPGTYTALLIVQDETGNRSQTSSGVTVRTTPPPTTTIGIQADLSVTKSAPATVHIESSVDYKVTVMNLGPSPATNVRMMDTLPGPGFFDLPRMTIDPKCTRVDLVITCNLGTLAPGASVAVTFSAPTSNVGSIKNIATASATEPDPNSSNNTDDADTNITITLIADSIVEASFGSNLEGAPEARLQLNDAAFEAVRGEKPERIRLSARLGVNVVSAEVLSKSDGSWTFDFSGTARFVPGSIEVEAGDVVSLTATSVVFGIREGAPARARFRFKLSP